MFQVHAVDSPQTGLHPRLDEVVQRHLQHRFRRPPAPPTRRAWSELQTRLDGRPLILDACCGVGESSDVLAARWPGHQVIGVDRSAERLSRRIPRSQEALLLRADLVDFWLLAAAEGLHFERVYLLYPNPYPKTEHLQRRWHAHPILPWLLDTAGTLELRSNWRLYLDEWARAFEIATGLAIGPEAFVPDPIMTAFERKYARGGQTLYRWQSDTVPYSLPPDWRSAFS
ncbi:MAG: tRNA (guanine(46)-N(7))-methyltransferase TrmB [Candidatus Sericytochromatia bacterium]